jgi:hypothetical protein
VTVDDEGAIGATGPGAAGVEIFFVSLGPAAPLCGGHLDLCQSAGLLAGATCQRLGWVCRGSTHGMGFITCHAAAIIRN